MVHQRIVCTAENLKVFEKYLVHNFRERPLEIAKKILGSLYIYIKKILSGHAMCDYQKYFLIFVLVKTRIKMLKERFHW